MADAAPGERLARLVKWRPDLVKRIVKSALAKHGGDPARGAEWCRRRAELFRRSADRLRCDPRRKRLDDYPAAVDMFSGMWLTAADELTCRGLLERDGAA